jgi:hypothetical protein
MIMDTSHKLRGGEGVIYWVEVQGCKCEIFSPTSKNHRMHDKLNNHMIVIWSILKDMENYNHLQQILIIYNLFSRWQATSNTTLNHMFS